MTLGLQETVEKCGFIQGIQRIQGFLEIELESPASNLRPALICLRARDLDTLDTLDARPILLINLESKHAGALRFPRWE
jgi:hypothetical protein